MIERHFEGRLKKLLREFPAVCLLGPRQCGKTTFIRSAFPRWSYFDLEKPSDAARFIADPEDALNRLGSRFILDEAQRQPNLFPVLRSFLDSGHRQNGRLILLGSASPALVRGISESLAGRVGFLDLTPFRWDEVRGQRRDFTLENLWFRGGFPDVFLSRSSSARMDWFEAYTRTWIERDLSALKVEVSSLDMRRLWTMLAHVNGGIWNASQLASSLGVSYHTVNRYVGILEQAFMIRVLRPYFANIGKRLVKSPKIYFRDTGLLHYFLGIAGSESLFSHPARGSSWESFVIEEILSFFQLNAPSRQAYFLRTASYEVDLLLAHGSRLLPFEIKLNGNPRREDVPGIFACMRDLKLDQGYVLYPGKEDYSLGNGVAVLSVEKILSQPSLLIDL